MQSRTENIKIEDSGMGLKISVLPNKIQVIVMTSGILIGAIAGSIVMIRSKMEMSGIPLVIPFIIMEAIAFYILYVMALSKIVFEVSSGKLVLKKEPLPWFQKSFQTNEIRSLLFKEVQVNGRQAPYLVYELYFKKSDESEVKLETIKSKKDAEEIIKKLSEKLGLRF